MRNKDTNRTEFTNGQLAIEDALKHLGFVPDLEQYFAPYTLDIFLRNIYCAIEFDASHTFRKKDKKRDDYLMEYYKIPTLRIAKIPKKDELNQVLLDFIWEWAPSAEERKKILWNI